MMSGYGKDELSMRKLASSMPGPELTEKQFVKNTLLRRAKEAMQTTDGLDGGGAAG